MLFTLLKKSFVNQKKAMALMIASVAVGTAVAASLITLSFEIRGKVSRELRAFGANILIQPGVEGLADISGQKRYLRQQDIIKAKTIFWRHNILGIAPFLETRGTISYEGRSEKAGMIGVWYEKKLPLPGEAKTFNAGISTVSPWWNIQGRWPVKPDEVLLGRSLADKFGAAVQDSISIDSTFFNVTGILETGGKEDDHVIMNLESLQSFSGLNGKISRVLVSALTKPMDEFAYKEPEKMGQAEYERWYCTGYVTSISKQLEEVFRGSKARPVWNIAETEGRVLNHLEILIYFLALMAVAASALGVSTTMIMSLLRRTDEIGLMKSVGADSGRIIALFLAEGAVIGFMGGLFGYLLSLAASRYIGIEVFNTGLVQRGLLFPVAIGSAVVISIAGTLLPIRKAFKIKPDVIMRGV
jgi:putative ABC transport system permease protein